MRTLETIWNESLTMLLQNAHEIFCKREEYSLLREKLDRAEQDCEINFSKDDLDYFSCWIEAQAALDGAEGWFLYEQGFRDCVAVLNNCKLSNKHP